ncbi:MAG: DUF2185 domain-containing protein [Lachnospiraceae bacterium]|nr:DUF2185 domain-containing protein [Lachnospiraceae bacterium]
MINNSAYGGFIVSKNVIKGIKILYSYREKSLKKELNGWTIMSENDDDEYASDPKNFVIVTAETLFKFAPVMEEIFDAPYGTDLYWKYIDGTLIGFYDLVNEKDVSIEEILN